MFRNLEEEMAKRKITKEELANCLGQKKALAIGEMLKNSGKFKFQEARRIQKRFFPDLTMAYLFEEEDERS